MIETMDRLAIIHVKKNVETTVRLLDIENDRNYGEIGDNPSQKNC